MVNIKRMNNFSRINRNFLFKFCKMYKYNEEIQVLEKEELELQSSDTNIYIKLMAYYLVQNKLFDAKFLWSRIPQIIRKENNELQRLNELQKNLAFNNFSEVFKNITEFEWSEEIKLVMEDLRVITLQNIFQLIGKAYTSILDATLVELTNLNGEQLDKKCSELDWTLEKFGQQLIFHPKKPTAEQNTKADSEYQLSKLTEFVSFLEN